MGVTSLWTVVAPTARPTQLASLNRKRLAVDASIWIYQFLKAVRDKEGNALRNSHVVGFFRRICKLLYFGIKPVFVFDGGAPILKRETVRSRARRREGRREDAARTAGKLLAVQVARAAEEEEKKRRAQRERTPAEEEIPEDQELIYVDEIGMDQKQRQAGRVFKKKDQYHLPDLDVSIDSMGAPNDPRIMSQAELEEYARQFHSGEDINIYDFSKIDFESPFFLSLPPGDRYNILNAARLRSRLRMGYSKEQLDSMFPDRMAFSRFQIERVKERNELTQRLMHVYGMAEGFLNQGGRIAGEKGKEYVLVKNDGVEGGWALGVVSNTKGSRSDNAIDLEVEENSDGSEISEHEDDFEDVAIEGLNRIPKQWQRKHKENNHEANNFDAAEEIARKRKAVYESRRAVVNQPAISTDADPLFIQQDFLARDADEEDELFEDVDEKLFEDLENRSEDEEEKELRRAIAMSLEQNDKDSEHGTEGKHLMGNASKRDLRYAAAGRVGLFDEDDDDLDLHAALAESRKSRYQRKTNVRSRSPEAAPSASANRGRFDGPLPFESLNLGQSLLGKKKSKKMEEELSGGFDRTLGENTFRKEKPAQPLPSWFSMAPTANGSRQVEPDADSEPLASMDLGSRGRNPKRVLEVIDVDELSQASEDPEIDRVSAENSEFEVEEVLIDEEEESTADVAEVSTVGVDLEAEKADLARNARYRLAQQIADANGDKTDNSVEEISNIMPGANFSDKARTTDKNHNQDPVDWSDSDPDEPSTASSQLRLLPKELEQIQDSPGSYDSDQDEEFEDVDGVDPPFVSVVDHHERDIQLVIPEADGEARDEFEFIDGDEAPVDYMSDSEEELMRQLAVEAEEHARFASSLNNVMTKEQAARDYENELKQLRNQQKKDRRDADEVTQVMVQECQALLRLFGLPYITAPMEAEAQCAELVHLGLVDGIVTDDSDVFLFGGTRIYKNMFNAAKYVECYLAADLEKEYALDRRKLIRFAHLLGSDYTEGIPGVGPVTALEILTDFQTLEEFKDWCSKVQTGRPRDIEDQLTTPFRRKFKNTVQKRLFLPPGFPDVRVDQAYLQPDVDSSPEDFQWGVPDLDKLRGYLMATIGWSQERTDEILVPVIRDMNKRDLEGTQSNITKFFSGAVGVGAVAEFNAPRRRAKESGRMTKAFARLRGEAEKRRDFPQVDTRGNEAVDPGSDGGKLGETKTAQRRKAARKAKKSAIRETEAIAEEGDSESSASQFSVTHKRRRKALR